MAVSWNKQDSVRRIRHLRDYITSCVLTDGRQADWLIQHILIDELIHHPASIRAACEQVITA